MNTQDVIFSIAAILGYLLLVLLAVLIPEFTIPILGIGTTGYLALILIIMFAL